MGFFEQPIDCRSRSAMIDFLAKHGRYDTGNSLNRKTSYANCVKIRYLGLTHDQEQTAYDLLSSDDNIWDQLDQHIDDFTRRHHGAYTIGANGRSNGYLVLYSSNYRETGYKSRCWTCGQLNYRRVAKMPTDPVESVIAQILLASGLGWPDDVYIQQFAIRDLPGTDESKLGIIRRFKQILQDCTAHNRCGRCGAEGESGRINIDHPHRTLQTSISSLDAEHDFQDWSLSDLRARVDLVRDFDGTCDRIRQDFIGMAASCRVVEQTIMVPKTVRRTVCAQHPA